MRLRLGSGLIPLNLLAWGLVAVIFFAPYTALRIILGIPFLLFFPGYSLAAALFPRREGLDGIERAALSFGLSLAVVPIIGFILDHTPLGIRPEPVLYSVASFIFVSSLAAWVRWIRLPAGERFRLEFGGLRPIWGGDIWGKTLSIILVVTIIGAIGTLGYVIIKPKVEEAFTEFYVLGPEGEAAGYSRDMVVGEEGKVILGIINREHRTVSYQIEVVVDGVEQPEPEAIVLEHNEKREVEVSFRVELPGANQRVEFRLYNGETGALSRSLHFDVNVAE